MLSRFPVIVGPTAGGKTALAIELARRLRAEHDLSAQVVSADAFQVYRELDLGTAKPTPTERSAYPHHLIDCVDPTDSFSVDRWLGMCDEALRSIVAQGDVPIVVGGTMMYIKALLDGLFEGPSPDEALREKLRALPRAALRERLEQADPLAAQRIHPNDIRRTIRALEVFTLTGTPISEHQRQWDRSTRDDCLLIGLEWPAEDNARRINARFKVMVEQGLVDEVRDLESRGRLGPHAGEALGYKQIREALRDGASIDDAIERSKVESRRFAKNQRTWLRRLRTTPGALWFDASEMDRPIIAQHIANKILR